MIKTLGRSAKFYFPSESVVFDNDGRKLVFEFHDDNLLKNIVYWASGFSSASICHYLFTQKPELAAVGLGFSLASVIAAVKSSSKIVSKMCMLQDGKSVEITTYDFIKRRTRVLAIDDIRCFKGPKGFRIDSQKKTFLLDQEGKIHDIHLFYAILRNLNVRVDK